MGEKVRTWKIVEGHRDYVCLSDGREVYEISDEFMHKAGLCGLCGNYGVVDTRGHMFSPADVECGVLAFCICPNGRAWKRAGASLEALGRCAKLHRSIGK